jgi:DNA modification methylase
MILHAHILDAIKQIPDGSVHCVVTSPPYWGLRNYGTEPQVWPDSLPLCETHDWNEAPPRRKRKSTDVVDVESKQATNAGAQHDLPTSDFCRRCNAWRGELGLEPTPELYVKHMVEIFREVRRVLRKDGTLWLNLGDSYAGSNCGSNDYRPEGASLSKSGSKYHGQKPGLPPGLKPKDLVGIPWMVAFALRADGWWLRSDIIFHKPNPMPESVTDRPTKSHEYIFLLTKSKIYFYDQEAVREQTTGNAHKGRRDQKLSPRYENDIPQEFNNRSGTWKQSYLPSSRNLRSVWNITTKGFLGAHFATFPPEIPERCIKIGTSQKGCCPKCGAPWERIIGKGLTAHEGSSNTQYPKTTTAGRLALLRQAARERGEEYQNETHTLGWKPTCDCGEEAVIPCTVLDPFGGSGTTAEVAKRLGRDFILIELKKEYITELIEPRISAINPLFAEKP